MTFTFWFFITGWFLRLAMTPIVLHRGRHVSSVTWLGIIYFEPIIGSLLYAMFSKAYLPRKRIREYEQMIEKVDSATSAVGCRDFICEEPTTGHYQDLIKLSKRLGSFPCVSGNKVNFTHKTTETFDSIVNDIDQAQDHVHLLFYIFENDDTGRRIAEALIRAVDRGVKCRVLADDVGSWYMFSGLGEDMKSHGVEVHALLPVNPLRKKLERVDLRNHRKLVVIDGKIAYTGSQNIVDDDYGKRDLTWHDVMMRITGPAVRHLQLVFIEDWHYESGELLNEERYLPELEPTGNVPIQTVPTGPSFSNEALEHLIISSIHHAREKVTITTPYLIPNESMLTAFEVAAMRGVKITIVVPERSDHLIVTKASQAYYRYLLELGAELYRHHQGLLHAKTLVIDDAMAIVGSANFDIRSLRLNFELNLLLFGESVAQQVSEIQNDYIADSRLLQLDDWADRPWTRKFQEDLAKLFSPLL